MCMQDQFGRCQFDGVIGDGATCLRALLDYRTQYMVYEVYPLWLRCQYPFPGGEWEQPNYLTECMACIRNVRL